MASATGEPRSSAAGSDRSDDAGSARAQVRIGRERPARHRLAARAGAGEIPPAAMGFMIDLHTHILPKTWPDLDARYGYGGFVRMDHYQPCRARMMIGQRVFREIGDNCWDINRRLDECAAAGVEMQVLSTVPVMFSYWARPHQALELHRFLNDHLAEVCRRWPRHYVGLGTVPLQSPTLAIQELERCVEVLGLAGVQIGSHVNDWNLDAPELFPFFEAAADLG
ncbi:MAG: amidohydrolase family protein, partial [Phycisphaerales bacterium]|nr:amidohydrolase family protein [Phycisphaerales bacterium]